MPELPEEAEIGEGTLRDLLEMLFRNSHFIKEIADPKTGELSLDGQLAVSLNDVPYLSLPDGLDSALADGDRLTLSLILIGGG
jgi:hypothetical protein